MSTVPVTSEASAWLDAINTFLQKRNLDRAKILDRAKAGGLGESSFGDRTIRRILGKDAFQVTWLTAGAVLDSIISSFGVATLDGVERQSVKNMHEAFRAGEPHLELRCVGGTPQCKINDDIYAPDRFCESCSIKANWPEAERAKYTTLLPQWTRPLDPTILPPLAPATGEDPPDLFACFAGPHGPPSRPSKWSDSKLQQYLPYRKDHLRSFGWRCGSPRLYRSERLETTFGLKDVTVLDMGCYQWSRSLKDPRAWAIVNQALDTIIEPTEDSPPAKRHLGIWTAGNAGLAVGLLAHAANLYLPAESHLQVYALYNQDEDHDGLGIAAHILRHWQCRTAPVPNRDADVEYPDDIKRRVRGMSLVGWSDDNYWDVSDGWEVVGSLMYRLLFAQILDQLKPDVLVVPAGTGNLLVGAWLAAQDCHREAVTKIVAAVPKNANVFDRGANQPAGSAENEPCMPKLKSAYSPLMPCLDHVKSSFDIQRVSLTEQQHTARHLMQHGSQLAVVSEPSGLSAFAALSRLKRHKTDKICVVNTGYGLMREDERAFWLTSGL